MASLHSVAKFVIYIIVLIQISETKSTDVTFEELEGLIGRCRAQYSCQERKKDELLEAIGKMTCHCDSLCSKLGTCCLDSPFRERNRTTEVSNCISENGRREEGYFMIGKCPFNGNAFKKQCEEEKNAEDDLMSRIPVTSVSTHLTYKNYFCFKCNEASDNYIFWSVGWMMRSIGRKYKDVIPIYNKGDGTWLAPAGRDGSLSPVGTYMALPPVFFPPRRCFSNHLISNCSDNWLEDELRRKCGMYMSVIYVSGTYYRNPHCALCNFKNLKRFSCPTLPEPSLISPFSFTYLLDINPSNGGKVGKIQHCDDSSTWDPFYKKCRRLGCALPGYVIRNGKCRAP